MLNLPYVIVTPAHNEESHIEATIRSVITQSVLPVRWVIVNDGSTDGTDGIVSRFLANRDWIRLLHLPPRTGRDFGGKVRAIEAALKLVEDLKYEVLACLDADISFQSGYFAFLLSNLAADSNLGVVGTPFVEERTGSYDYRFTNIEHVSGACQVFRRQCYEEIGGYSPIEGGGVDLVAVTTARMKGWKTRTFTGMSCFHARPMGTAQNRALSAAFNLGTMDYALGNHPLWELSRAFYQMSRKPRGLRGVALGLGYLFSSIRGCKRPVSRDFVEFCRREQLQRLKRRAGELVPWIGLGRRGSSDVYPPSELSR